MNEEQWTMFCVLLGGLSLPSVSLLFLLAWELYNYDITEKTNQAN